MDAYAFVVLGRISSNNASETGQDKTDADNRDAIRRFHAVFPHALMLLKV